VARVNWRWIDSRLAVGLDLLDLCLFSVKLDLYFMAQAVEIEMWRPFNAF